MKRCFERAEKRFEKPNGVSNKFYMWTMIVIAVLGLIASMVVVALVTPKITTSHFLIFYTSL